MKTMIGILAGLLLATGGCRRTETDAERRADRALPRPVEPNETPPEEGSGAAAAPSEPAPRATTPVPEPTTGEPAPTATAPVPPDQPIDDRAFLETRDAWGESAQQRMERIEARIAELETRSDESARETVMRLRAQQDELRVRLETLKDQVRVGWEQFKAEAQRAFDELEYSTDQAFRPSDPRQPE